MSTAVEFDAALAAVLARHVAGYERLDGVRRLSGGASQETYAIDVTVDGASHRLALRRAPGGAPESTAYGRPGLDVEAELIRLAGDAGVPEPAIVHVLEPGDGLGEGFLMSWVEGETLGARIARHDDFAAVRPRLARQCGEILARIHAVDVGKSRIAGRLERLEPEQFVRRQWELYRGFATPQPMIDYTARWLLEHLPRPRALTLVHNDFRNGNLIVSPRDGVVAVLDWEVAHIGDPMRDIGWICTNSWRFGVTERVVGGFGELEDLIAGYEAVSAVPIDRDAVHFWQVFGSFWWAIGCLTMFAHYRDGTDRAVERPAIGRRSSECQVDCVNLLLPGPPGTLPTGAPALAQSDMPRTEEILVAVRDFLRDEVAAEASGRNRFMAKVAANALDIVARELADGPVQAAAERARLATLLGQDGDVDTLRAALCARLQAGAFALDDPALTNHLRETVIARVAIDQPGYSGLRTALAAG
ncbi:MAG: phosphotransferase family protein [Gammaproteobacteria bacterium]